MSTGSRISQLRSRRQWSQTYFARKVGTNVNSVKDWENDVSLPTVKNVKKLCSLFKVSADYLLEMDDVPTIILKDLPQDEIDRIQAVVQTMIDIAVLRKKKT